MPDKRTLEENLVQLRRIGEHREKNAEKEIRKLFKELLENLKHFVADEYAKYAVDDKLTIDVLYQKSQYAKFLDEVERRINNLTPETSKQIRELVEEVYSLSYNGMVEAVKSSKDTVELAAALKGIKAATPEVIKRAVENPISGLTLKDTLERNRRNIIYSIKQEIGIGLMNGDRYSTMARRISDKLNVNYKKAVTIARTETHRVREAGFHDSAERISNETQETGLVYVKTWVTMRDERVRPQVKTSRKKGSRRTRTTYITSATPNHRKMDGKTIKIDELFDLGGGVTAKAPTQTGVAGHDVNCRCFLRYKFLTEEEYKNL